MEQHNKPTIPQLLEKLDVMFVKERTIKTQIIKLCKELEQVQEDTALMEEIIMHQSNKQSRDG